MMRLRIYRAAAIRLVTSPTIWRRP